MSDFFSSRGGGTSESSEMSLSASLVSNDGYGEFTASLAQMFPPVLDQDLSSVGILLEDNEDLYHPPVHSTTVTAEGLLHFTPATVHAGTITPEALLHFTPAPVHTNTITADSLLLFAPAPVSREGADSGEVTPVSVSASSEFDFGGEEIRYKDTKPQVQQLAIGGDIISDVRPLAQEDDEEEDKTLTTYTLVRDGTVEDIMGTSVSKSIGNDNGIVMKPAAERSNSRESVACSYESRGSVGNMKSLAKTVESMAMVEKKGKIGSYLGTKFVGKWVMESTENLESFGKEAEKDEYLASSVEKCDGTSIGLEPDANDEEDRTITSSMTATSPARKSIFQVFGSPVSRHTPPSNLSTSCGKESKLSTSLTPSTESDITERSDLSVKPQSALSVSLKSPSAKEADVASSGSPEPHTTPIALPKKSAPEPSSNSIQRQTGKSPVISCFSREFKMYSSGKTSGTTPDSSRSFHMTETSPSPDLNMSYDEGNASGPDGSSSSRESSDAVSSIRAVDIMSPGREPVLTLASSLTDTPCVLRGFKVLKDEPQ